MYKRKHKHAYLGGQITIMVLAVCLFFREDLATPSLGLFRVLSRCIDVTEEGGLEFPVFS